MQFILSKLVNLCTMARRSKTIEKKLPVALNILAAVSVSEEIAFHQIVTQSCDHGSDPILESLAQKTNIRDQWIYQDCDNVYDNRGYLLNTDCSRGLGQPLPSPTLPGPSFHQRPIKRQRCIY